MTTVIKQLQGVDQFDIILFPEESKMILNVVEGMMDALDILNKIEMDNILMTEDRRRIKFLKERFEMLLDPLDKEVSE